MNQPSKLTINDIAELLGVSRSTVDRYITQGIIPQPDMESEGGHRNYNANGRGKILDLFYSKKHQIPSEKWKVISFFNQKGGVGKTISCVNLAASLAYLDYRVLVVDMDPQGHAGLSLNVDPTGDDHDIYDVLLHGTPILDVAKPAIFSQRGAPMLEIDVVPSTVRLAGAENEMHASIVRHEFLRAVLAPIQHRYDYILVDCPPSLGLLSINTLYASDAVIIPFKPEPMALRGIYHLIQTIDLIKRPAIKLGLNHPLSLAGVLITDYEEINLQKAYIEEVREHFGSKVFKSMIPHRAHAQESRHHQKPLLMMSSEGKPAADAYLGLAHDLLGIQNREIPIKEVSHV